MDYTKLEAKLNEDLEYLTENPSDIRQHWESSSPLFEFVGNTRDDMDEMYCGCLTMIADRNGCWAFNNGLEDDGLTHLIMKDGRLRFINEESITVESLPVFKKWQLGIRQYFDGNMTLNELAQYVGVE